MNISACPCFTNCVHNVTTFVTQSVLNKMSHPYLIGGPLGKTLMIGIPAATSLLSLAQGGLSYYFSRKNITEEVLPLTEPINAADNEVKACYHPKSESKRCLFVGGLVLVNCVAITILILNAGIVGDSNDLTSWQDHMNSDASFINSTQQCDPKFC